MGPRLSPLVGQLPGTGLPGEDSGGPVPHLVSSPVDKGVEERGW